MAKEKRRIKLECTVCKKVGYFPNKSRLIKNRLELKKYCRSCRKHTAHKETK